MATTLHVAIPPVPRRAVGAAAEPLLAASGAQVILGAADAGEAIPVAPSAHSLFGPRGACVASGGSLWVADTGHHRLLGWHKLPTRDCIAADILIGQPDFCQEGRNAKGEPGPATLNVPTGITAAGDSLIVADGWNHRVLIWNETPEHSHQPADIVLGQRDFNSGESNRGAFEPTASSLFWPFGVAWDGERLWVADTGNRRVLVWQGLPTRNGQPADQVLGQLGFNCRDENAGGSPNASSMRWPHAIAFLDNGVCIADAGNNRVMVWDRIPVSNGQACDAVLGQRDLQSVDHNQGDYWPSAGTLNMPYGLAAQGRWLIVTDTASSRLVAWHADDVRGCGSSATRLAAQPDWESKGDNRWLPAARDSLCWPFAVHAHSEFAIIADAGNNRVLLWSWDERLKA